MTETDEAPQALFWDLRNIVYGNGPNAARILYAPRLLTTSGDELPAGWCLPGGARTTDKFVATAAAALIYRLTMEYGK